MCSGERKTLNEPTVMYVDHEYGWKKYFNRLFRSSKDACRRRRRKLDHGRIVLLRNHLVAGRGEFLKQETF